MISSENIWKFFKINHLLLYMEIPISLAGTVLEYVKQISTFIL